jgi:hypothetical protein
MGQLPDWVYFVQAATLSGTHPAMIAGLEDTIHCHCWVSWIVAWDSAKNEAREQKQRAYGK